MVTGRRLDGEPVGLLDPPLEHRHQASGIDGQREHPPEPERPGGQAVDDGDEAGPHPVAGGALRATAEARSAGAGQFGRRHLGQGVGGAEHRAGHRRRWPRTTSSRRAGAEATVSASPTPLGC